MKPISYYEGVSRMSHRKTDALGNVMCALIGFAFSHFISVQTGFYWFAGWIIGQVVCNVREVYKIQKDLNDSSHY